MKIKEDFLLRQVADTWVVLPLGSAIVSMDGMLNLNETGALLWKTLEQGADREQLVDALLAEYAVDRGTAAEDVDEFIEKLKAIHCLEL